MADTDMDGEQVRVMVSSQIQGYLVLVVGDRVLVRRDDELVTCQVARGLGRFIVGARRLCLGWVDDGSYEVLYLFDRAQGNYGYAVNLMYSSPLSSLQRTPATAASSGLISPSPVDMSTRTRVAASAGAIRPRATADARSAWIIPVPEFVIIY